MKTQKLNILKKEVIKIAMMLFFGVSIYAQELPPIVKYSSALYGAGNQNWMISQDSNHFVFLQIMKGF